MITITSARFWHNLLANLLQRIKKLPGTTESIAIGIACGVAISFTPFLGFHMVLAAGSAWLLGGSIVASALGTIVGNPWTFPFIWIAVLYTGRKLLRLEHSEEPTDFEAFFSSAWQALKEPRYLAHFMADDNWKYTFLHYFLDFKLFSGKT